MKYKRFDNTIVLRLEIGEEIITSITEVAKKENIKLATVTGIGAVDDLTIGVFKPKEKKYYSNHFVGDFEVLSINGNLSTMNNEVYQHLHIAVGNVQGHAFGGHLNEAVVSVTAEIFINIIDGEVDRFLDESININLMDL